MPATIEGDGQKYAVLNDGRAFPVHDKGKRGTIHVNDKVLIMLPENPNAVIGGGNHYAEVLEILN